MHRLVECIRMIRISLILALRRYRDRGPSWICLCTLADELRVAGTREF